MSIRRYLTAGALALGVTLLGGVARADDAQQGPPAGPPPNPNTSPGTNPSAFFGLKQAATIGLGYGQIGGSYYLQLRPYMEFNLGKVGIGAIIPLNLLSPLPSPDPKDKADTWGGVLRKADWPTPNNAAAIGHYLSLVRMVRYGLPTDPFYIQYGQFFGYSMGHGTIIDRYNNTLDPDHPKPGLAFAINRDSFGIEAFTDSITWPATSILAGRAYIRPLALGKDDPGLLAKRWAVGFTFADDRNAPRLLSGQSATVLGIDTELKVLSNSLIELTPYVDLNQQRTETNAAGLHVGALARFRFPIISIMNLWARLEFRAMQPGYIPGYFDMMYDMQRTQYPVADGVSIAKASAGNYLAPHGPQGLAALTKGIFGEAAMDILGIVQGGASYAAIPGVPKSGNLTVFATLPKLDTLKVSAYYVRKNFDAASELTHLDERSLIAATVLYKVWGPLWLSGTFNRHWIADYASDDADHEKAPVGYHGVNDWNLGVQAYLPF